MEILFEVDLSEKEKLRIGVNQYRGKHRISIRRWYRPEDSADLRPTQRGVEISDPGIIDDLILALEKGRDRLLKINRK